MDKEISSFIRKRKEKVEVKNSKVYYGGTTFEKEELTDARIDNRIELEYYRTKNEHNRKIIYGIEVIKKEYKEKEINIESNNINNISDSINMVEGIIDTLKKHKVTPICLNDVVEDIMYQEITE